MKYRIQGNRVYGPEQAVTVVRKIRPDGRTEVIEYKPLRKLVAMCPDPATADMIANLLNKQP